MAEFMDIIMGLHKEIRIICYSLGKQYIEDSNNHVICTMHRRNLIAFYE